MSELMAGERLQPGLAVMLAAVLEACCVKKAAQNVFPRWKLVDYPDTAIFGSPAHPPGCLSALPSCFFPNGQSKWCSLLKQTDVVFTKIPAVNVRNTASIS